MHTIYLLTGSNLQNPFVQLQTAVQKMEQQEILKVVKASSVYQTAAWGLHAQPDFLNQVLQCQTNLEANELLKKILEVEAEMGRVRTAKNDPRIIDIDILFYDEAIIEAEHLIVPHPLLHLRRFVLVPLQEIAPQLLHPVLKKTISQLLDECADPLHVNKFYEGR